MEARIVSEILKKNEPFLSRHLVLSRTVLDKLCQCGLLADYTRRKIMFHPADRQVEVLLQTLEKRGLPSLRKFLEVLKDTGHGYLVDIILDTEAIPVTDLRPDTTQPVTGTVDYHNLRPTHTVHATHRHGNGHMASLNSLLRMREEKEQTTRGSWHPRTLLTDPVAAGFPGGRGGLGMSVDDGIGPGYPHHPSSIPARSKDNLPGTLYSLGQIFNQEQKQHEQALVVLRQEEMAIKQLMEQNARDQQKIRRKQFTVSDINKKLADINARASEVYEPTPHPNISRYRLAQLNQIPWSVDH